MTEPQPKLKLSNNKGFHLTFKNGMTISVQFGIMNYCNRVSDDVPESPNSEIAIWDKEGTWYDFGSDQVKGYCSPDEVANWIHIVSFASDFDDIRRQSVIRINE